jgi:hypothetical protein
MVVSASKIKALHEGLEGAIRRELGDRVCIRLPSDYWKQGHEADPEQSWEGVLSRLVYFELQPQNASLFDQAMSGPSGRVCAVVAVDEERLYDPSCRLSWLETWNPVGGGEFELVAAGWQFYWGRFGPDRPKRLLFRAEWDHPRREGADAPQPHWHFHPVSLNAISTDPGAKLLKPFLRMHMGMAGWNNGDGYPDCWQWHPEQWSDHDIVHWASKVLEAVLAELRVRAVVSQ